MPDDGRVCVLALTDKSRNRRAGYVYDPRCDSRKVVPIEHAGMAESDVSIPGITATCELPGSRLAVLGMGFSNYDGYRMRIFTLAPVNLW
jgi:hypothetical protein